MDLFVESDQVSCQDKQLILDEHNSLREKISFGEIQGMPSAANMRELVRDNFRSIFLIFKKKILTRVKIKSMILFSDLGR